MPVWLTTILPMFGILIGAIMQFIFSRKSEFLKDKQKLRIQAYIDYCKAISERKFANQYKDKAKELSSIANQTDAKLRIMIYGSKDAIKALYEFEKSGAKLNNQQSQDYLIEMLKTFRNEFNNDKISNIILTEIIFDRDISLEKK